MGALISTPVWGCADGLADCACLLVGFADQRLLDWEESGRRYTMWDYSALDWEEMWSPSAGPQ